MSSSPAIPKDPHAENIRSKKAPSVTPRRFRRFFTPRTAPVHSQGFSAARQALRDITSPALNRGGQTTEHRRALGPFRDLVSFGDENATAVITRNGKRRKVLPTPEPLSTSSTPTKRRRTCPDTFVLVDDPGDASITVGLSTPPAVEDEDEDETTDDARRPLGRKAFVRFSEASVGARVLKRSMGELGSGLQAMHCAPAKDATTNFFSQASDVHLCSTVDQSERVPPFCTASCNTNTLVAIGDEKGGVRLLESARNGSPKLREAYLYFQPHDNAILDLAFSSDDLLLATASGDQTARIIDMPTRRTIATLAGHISSVKQVRFQPGQSSNNIIATSSRDGSVQLWDLRCKGSDKPTHRIQIPLDPSMVPVGDLAEMTTLTTTSKMAWARPVNSILDAHPERRPLSQAINMLSNTPSATEAASTRSESPGSVTALTFFPPGREHLLLTASEGNACIKLWDLRTTHTHRRGRAIPLSTTRQPESHDRYRHFGINALAWSGDAARLYSLCRDNTIYAYSTNHLILGSAPDLSHTTSRARRPGGSSGKEGLGPLFGLRHPLLHTATFYVKMSVRPATSQQSEILAVGSSDACAVLFPTDERSMRRTRRPDDTDFDRAHRSRPGLLRARNSNSSSRTPTSTGLSGRLLDTIPIYRPGTALIRGHQREVTGVSWTSEGELITASDDFLVRCWREGAEARDLRRGGETGGRRWGCGWAEPSDSWAEMDDDDDDNDGDV